MHDTQIANHLLDIKAVKINVKEPFTWASGIKSPIYCDCRIINSHVQVRNTVITKFVDLINRKFRSNVEVIAGVASGGISYGALIADRLGLPFIYIRERKKEHGLGKQIEGEFIPHNKIILIEDLISTGGSSLNAINSIREVGLELVALLSIMTYRFEVAEKRFGKANVQFENLCDLDTVLEVAYERNIINIEDQQKIFQFRESVNAGISE
jgi:orotate phosphoribosyltransferase